MKIYVLKDIKVLVITQVHVGSGIISMMADMVGILA